MRRLPARLRREIAAFAFLYRYTFPNCFLPSAGAELLAFDAELENVRALEDDTLAYELSRTLYDRPPGRDGPDAADRIREGGRFFGPEAGPLIELLLADPRAFAERFLDLFAGYWKAAFAGEWRRIEPEIASAVSSACARIAGEGLYTLLLDLAPQLKVDMSRNEFGIDVPHDHRVDLAESGTLVLVPSFYVWPHVRVNCDEPWPLTLIYSAPFALRAARRQLPSQELLRALRALADPTRLQALQLIAERPRSTQELAPLVGIGEAGLSKHLRQLAEAGLLSTRREGYYVLYSVEAERLRELTATLPRLLEPRA